MRKILFIILTSCLLVITTSALKPPSWSETITASEERRFWINKTFAAAKYDVVVLGDSRVYRGISPAAMEAILPDDEVLNYGYLNAGYFGDYLTGAATKLSHTASAPILVLGISPNSLTPEAAENSHYLQESYRSIPYRLLYTGFERVMSLFDPIDPAQIIIDLARAANMFKPFEKNVWPYQQLLMENGWNASDRIPRRPATALDLYNHKFTDNQVDDSIVNGLLVQVHLWVEQGIVVFGFRVPTTAEMIALEDNKSGFNEPEFVTRFQESGGQWLSVCGTCYVSYDGSHLSADGAVQLSSDLANLIAIYLTSNPDE